MAQSIINDLEKLAEAKGITVIDCSNGHYQLIGGPLLVNYYPYSKKKTAYVSSTTQGRFGVTPEEAVNMCFTPPPLDSKTGKRPNNTRRIRKKLLLQIRNCRWCDKELTLDNSTLEHEIPLARGGLDTPSNRTLACARCNHSRGSDMPELSKIPG